MHKKARSYLFSEILGILVIFLPWVFITIAIHLNPWFQVNVNALSDLGGNAYEAADTRIRIFQVYTTMALS